MSKETQIQVGEYPMVRAVMMTDKQATELVKIARDNHDLWEEVKARELEIEKRLSDAAKQGLQIDDRDAIFDPPQAPTLEEIASELIKGRYGCPDEPFERGTLIVEMRRAARLDLGLPV
jgi:hypothetical protein